VDVIPDWSFPMVNPVSGPAALPQGSSSSSPNDPNPSDVQQFNTLVSGVAPIAPLGDSDDPAMAQLQAGFVNGIIVKVINQQNKMIMNGFGEHDG
jgi:hypothetical protein